MTAQHDPVGDLPIGPVRRPPRSILDVDQLSRVPSELIERPQWVCWRYEWRVSKNGVGKWTKVPHAPGTHREADCTDPKQWGTYSEALEAYKADTYNDGIGFVFSDDDPFAGVDHDDSIDDAGRIKTEVLEFIAKARSYTEISPSGFGVKTWVRGHIPGPRRRKGLVEMYDRDRYFTVTGRLLEECPAAVNDGQAALDWQYEKAFGDALPPASVEAESADKHTQIPQGDETPDGDNGTRRAGPTDDQIIEKVAASKYARLWVGDASAYQSQSEADLALAGCIAFFAGPDASRIERIFSLSGLTREKWTERPKYRADTIARALNGKIKFYDWRGRKEERRRDRRRRPSSDADPTYLTDITNARELVSRFGAGFRYDVAAGKYRVFKSGRWALDDTGCVERWTKKIARAQWRHVAQPPPGTERNAAIKHAEKAESSPGISAMLKLARSEAGVSITADDWDARPWFLNCANGTLDLRTGQLKPHDPADLLTKQSPVEYHADARCPLFTRFMARIMDGRQDVIDYLQRLSGTWLTANVSEQELPIFWGEGANGKSVLLDTVVGMLGDYAGEAAPGLLTASFHQQHPTEIADLHGKRFVVASETEEGSKLRIQLVKRLTGNATLKGRFMRQDFFEFPRTHKLVLVTNNKPAIGEETNAVWRRVRVVPFTVVIPQEEQDKQLLSKLKAEWPGILAWMVQGCIAWQRDGLQTPECVTVATEEYRVEQDQLSGYVETRCVRGEKAFVSREEIYSDYSDWIGSDPTKLDRNSLYTRLRRLRGVHDAQIRVGGKPTRGFHGIGVMNLRSQYQEAQERAAV